MRIQFAKQSLSVAGVTLALAILAVLKAVAAPSAQAQTFTLLYSFTGSPDGETPYGGVDKSGAVYGTTYYGGTSDAGTVYQLKSGKETVLYSFTGSTDGGEPFAGVVIDKSGNLYGTTIAGGDPSCSCGVVYEVNPKTKKETVLHSFTGGKTDGSEPYGGLVMDENGNLYGTTILGGYSYGLGTVFKVDPKTKKETVLHRFTGGTDGEAPRYGNPAIDKSGNLYGTTLGGGTSSNGTVWEVSAKGKETVLYSFTGGADGDGVFEQSLATDDKGNLYGTTEEGGTDKVGNVFEVNVKSKKETVLYSFSSGGGDGENPSSGLVRDSKGNLYGTTQKGGANGLGTVFEVTGTKETILHSFDGSDGQSPLSSPLLDSTGTLYGTTYSGGANGDGTVFSIKP